ncbi:YhgE/Pip domain-containing protein [Lactococcus cremoris]|uniref:YhgE/Pip domain-containing protein n=1 Tax=Lactococcus lactis subsp. cremoris TaxID=1359 RepID=A0A1V0PIT0_LACLC|nr:YhgE/Pip domain-containing protein [Lactococcus cremoris]ARE28978.1 YhgE/Pip domain-containing protein [Lactococcus cremoris]
MKSIKNTWKLFALDWKRIFKNPVATFLIVALMIIPSLYAWFNIKALWDPYANTSQLPIAVYSADKPASFQDKTINIGDEVLKNLKKNHQLGWKFVDSKAELDKGVKSGKYYAGIYLPKDFSKDLLSFTTGDIKKPQIVYSINEKINAIAPKITSKGALSLQSQISEEFINTASSTLLKTFNTIGYDIDKNMVSIQKVKSAILSTNDNLGTIDKYTQQVVDLHGKMPEIKEKLAKANEFITYLPEVDSLGQKVISLNDKMPEIDKSLSLVLTLQEKIPEIQNAGKQISMIDEDFASVESTMTQGIQEAKDGLQIINQVQKSMPDIQKLGQDADSLGTITFDAATKMQQALPSITSSVKVALESIKDFSSDTSTIISTIEKAIDDNQLTSEEKQQINSLVTNIANIANQINPDEINSIISNALTTLTKTITDAKGLLNQAQQIDFEALLNSTSQTVSNAITILEKYQGEMPAIKQEIHDANLMLNGNMTTIVNAINEGASLYKNEFPILKSKLGTASDFFKNDYAGVRKDLTDTLTMANEKMPDVESALNQANSLIQNDWPEIKSGIQKAATAIQKGEKEVDLGEIVKLLKLDATKESDFLTQPVEVQENQVYPIANNGSASTPFYTALCLWVGAVLLSSLATTEVHLSDKDKKRYSKREQFFARMGSFVAIGLAQALIVTLGNYFGLGVDVRDPFYSVLFALLISIAFMIMVYVLVALFGNVGKGIAIIILVLSISGGGGNYPIQVSGKFFQAINPYLPFTHAVNLLRESAGGIYWPNAWFAIIILVAVSIVFVAIGAFLFPHFEDKTKKISEIGSKSHFFH